MAAPQDPSFAPSGASSEDLRAERADFDGVLLAALAYGALLMLYIQLTQVVLRKPKRGYTFCAIVAYSSLLFPLATLAIVGMFKFDERSYIDNRNYPGGSIAFRRAYMSDVFNIMCQFCVTLFPWFADLLMLYRILVIWNYRWWIIILPFLTYFAKLATSIPLLISQMNPNNAKWVSRYSTYATSYYSVTVAFNVIATAMICLRLHMMRRKLEAVLGRLGASLYTSTSTKFVESGAFFTFWSIIYLILRTRGSFAQDVFLYPYIHVLGITRMLIIFRMAQDQAWSKDIVMASARGVMDWQVSSTHSVPLHDITSVSSLDKVVLQRQKYIGGVS